MQEPISHHHVPVFYSRRWADSIGKVGVARNVCERIARSRKSPKYIGFEDYLYTYHDEFRVSNKSEVETTFFRRIDNSGAEIISDLIKGSPLTSEDAETWAIFISSMKIRNPDVVVKIENLSREILLREIELSNAQYLRRKSESDPESAVDWMHHNHPGLIESFGVSLIPKIAMNNNVVSDIMSFQWCIADLSNSTKPLLLSDRPCVFTSGLDSENCVIALPLTPKHAFFAFREGSKAQTHLLRCTPSTLASNLNISVVRQAKCRAYFQNASDAPDSFFERYLAVDLAPAKDTHTTPRSR